MKFTMARKKNIKPPLFTLLPIGGGFILFWVIPFILGVKISLQSNDLIGQPQFVGFDNYLLLLKDFRYFTALTNTFLYSLCCVFVIIPLSFILAYNIHHTSKKLKSIFILILTLPSLVPPGATAFLFVNLFAGQHGVLNNVVLSTFGLPSINWLKEPSFIKVALVIQATWRWLGLITLFLVVALQKIPLNYWKISKINNLSVLQTLSKMIFPSLKNAILFVLLFLWLDSIVLFEGAYHLLGSSGGPQDAGLLLVNYVYLVGFSYGKFGTATAMSLSIIPILLITGMVFIKLYQKKPSNFNS